MIPAQIVWTLDPLIFAAYLIGWSSDFVHHACILCFSARIASEAFCRGTEKKGLHECLLLFLIEYIERVWESPSPSRVLRGKRCMRTLFHFFNDGGLFILFFSFHLQSSGIAERVGHSCMHDTTVMSCL